MRFTRTTVVPAGDRGFGLIELLMVVLIIGILTTIAIPIYLGQRGRATEAAQAADARALAAQMETHFVEGQGYPGAGDLSWSPGPHAVQFTSSGEMVRLSRNNQARISRGDGDQKFCIEVRNPSTGTTAVYDSGGGGLQAIDAGAICPATYDQTVLAYPAS